MILTALFPAPRYLSKYSDSVSMRLYSLTLTPPRNSGFDLRVARPFYPFLGALANVSLWTTPFTRVEQRAQNLDKPRRMRERIEDRVVKRLKLLWSGGERRLVGFLLSGGSLGYQAEREREFTGNFTPVQPAVEGKRGGLIPESSASRSKRSGTSSFPAKLDLVSRSSSASIPSFPSPSFFSPLFQK